MSKYARVFGKSGAGDLMRNCSSGRVLRPVCPPRGGLDPSAAAGGFTRGLEGSLLLADWTKVGSEAKLASCLHPLESSLMTVEPLRLARRLNQSTNWHTAIWNVPTGNVQELNAKCK